MLLFARDFGKNADNLIVCNPIAALAVISTDKITVGTYLDYSVQNKLCTTAKESYIVFFKPPVCRDDLHGVLLVF